MNKRKGVFPKEEIYKNWNFTVSTYDFEVPNGLRAGKVLKLVELKTKTRRWSDEIGSYYTQNQYITISFNQLADLMKQASQKN